MTSLSAENICIRYGGKTLWQVDRLVLPASRLIHLQGANGSGKTTLMKVLSGLLKPDSGKVSVGLNALKVGDRRVCYLHQHPYLFDVTVQENLRLVLDSQRVTKKENAVRLEEAMSWAGLTELACQSARTLSGGQRQALAMARAWLCRPAFWLLDEPTASLDAEATLRFSDLVKQILDEGAGVLLTAHQSGPLSALCHESWVLKEGRLHGK